MDEDASEDLLRLPLRSTPLFVSAAIELDIAKTRGEGGQNGGVVSFKASVGYLLVLIRDQSESE
jgi:hypothetical protein